MFPRVSAFRLSALVNRLADAPLSSSPDFNITRERMDELAALSQQRAEKAQNTGLFDAEILPVDALVLPTGTPAASGGPAPSRTKVRVTKDDGIRPGTTKEKLSKIKSAFPQWGNGATTGGNASQITDGVAGVLLMTRRKAEELGLEILGKHVCTSVAGLPPRIMGIVSCSNLSGHVSRDDIHFWRSRSGRKLKLTQARFSQL